MAPIALGDYTVKKVTRPSVDLFDLGARVRVNKSRRIFMAETVTLPAHSRMVLWARVEGGGPSDKETEGIGELDKIFAAHHRLMTGERKGLSLLFFSSTR